MIIFLGRAINRTIENWWEANIIKSKMYWVTKLFRRPETSKTVTDEVHAGGYCKNCGKELVQLPGNHRAKKYCSTKCRVAW